MWILIGADYLNLDNLAAVRFRRDDGTLHATAEPISGPARHYAGEDAEQLRRALRDLCCHAVPEWEWLPACR
jgi:hypothetical protein